MPCARARSVRRPGRSFFRFEACGLSDKQRDVAAEPKPALVTGPVPMERGVPFDRAARRRAVGGEHEQMRKCHAHGFEAVKAAFYNGLARAAGAPVFIAGGDKLASRKHPLELNRDLGWVQLAESTGPGPFAHFSRDVGRHQLGESRLGAEIASTELRLGVISLRPLVGIPQRPGPGSEAKRDGDGERHTQAEANARHRARESVGLGVADRHQSGIGLRLRKLEGNHRRLVLARVRVCDVLL